MSGSRPSGARIRDIVGGVGGRRIDHILVDDGVDVLQAGINATRFEGRRAIRPRTGAGGAPAPAAGRTGRNEGGRMMDGLRANLRRRPHGRPSSSPTACASSPWSASSSRASAGAPRMR